MRGARVIVVVVAVCAAAVAPATSLAAEGVDDRSALIGQSGRWLTDAQGRAVIFHGVNVVPTAPQTTAGFDARDAAFLARSGMRLVRVGWQVSALEPRPGVIDRRYLQTIARTVDLLAAHGIHSLIDMHQDEWGPSIGIRGFPAWMTLDDGLLAPPTGATHPLGYWTSPAINRAWKNFWANAAVTDGRRVQDVFAAQWQVVARHFAGHPFVLGYDILNEPYPGEDHPYPVGDCWNPAVPGGCPSFDAALSSFNARIARAIHAVDPGHVVWYEAGQHTYTGRPNHLGDRVVGMAGLSMHAYCLEALFVPRNGATDAYCEPNLDRTMGGAVAHAQRASDAVLLSEFGATVDPAYWQQLTDMADRHMLPWTMWSYSELAGSWTDEGEPRANAAILAAVVRPHPQRIAGTPVSFGFDRATRTFRLRYRAAAPGAGRVTGPTEVFVPRLHYDGGYTVDVIGGRAVSAPGAERLLVERTAGTREVSVVVRPK